MEKYKASIIIPTFNRSTLLNMTLKSILKQNIDKNEFEVIIVDDGSSDNTSEVVQLFQHQLNIKYFFQQHHGFRAASARNIGIKNSSGTICIFVDSGILLASNCVSNQISLHNKNINSALIGYVYGFDEFNENANKLLDLNINPLNVDNYFDYLENNQILDSRESLYKQLGDDLTRWPAPWVIFYSAYISVKRSILLNLGMFDETFNSWGAEDIDLGITLYKNNIQILLDRNLKCIHYPHPKFKSKFTDDEIKKYTQKKKEYLNQKHHLFSTQQFIYTDSKNLNQLLLNMN